MYNKSSKSYETKYYENFCQKNVLYLKNLYHV